MRKQTLILLTLLLLPALFLHAQEVDQEGPAGDQKFERVEIEASYPGGVEAWRNYLAKNLKADVPVKNGAPIGLYTVVIQFVVDKQGEVSQVKALTNHGYGMEEEVIRILRKSGTWKPAQQNGRPVNAFRKQPVTFQVSDESVSIATASADLYTDTDNPLSIEVDKVKPENISLTVASGSATIIKEADGKYIIRSKKAGRIVIDIYSRKKNKKINSMSFEVIDK